MPIVITITLLVTMDLKDLETIIIILPSLLIIDTAVTMDSLMII